MGLIFVVNSEELTKAKECIRLAREYGHTGTEANLIKQGSLIMDDLERMEAYKEEINLLQDREVEAAKEAAAIRRMAKSAALKEEQRLKEEKSAMDRQRTKDREVAKKDADRNVRLYKKGFLKEVQLLSALNNKSNDWTKAYKEVIERKLNLSFLA